MHMYRRIGKFGEYIIFDCINWRSKLLSGAHDFGGATPRAAQRQINIPTLQSYRLWSVLSARQPGGLSQAANSLTARSSALHGIAKPSSPFLLFMPHVCCWALRRPPSQTASPHASRPGGAAGCCRSSFSWWKTKGYRWKESHEVTQAEKLLEEQEARSKRQSSSPRVRFAHTDQRLPPQSPAKRAGEEPLPGLGLTRERRVPHLRPPHPRATAPLAQVCSAAAFCREPSARHRLPPPSLTPFPRTSLGLRPLALF